MQDKLKILYIIFFIALSQTFAQSNEEKYNFNLDIGIGPSKYVSGLDYENYHNTHPFSLTFRLMWEPEHRLRIGLETGYLPLFYSNAKFYDTINGDTDSEISMNSVPLLLLFAMKIYKNVEIIGGVGGFILISDVNVFNNHVVNKGWSNAYEFGINYLYPVSKKIKLGAEAKSFYILRFENFDYTINFLIKYSFYTY